MFLEFQLKYLLWLQNMRELSHDFFTPLFSYITCFGEYLLPTLTCAIVYWCVDKKLGALIILNGAVSLMVNQLFKSMACIARPWILDNHIKPVETALPHAGGYSFPSGHSSVATSCWGAIGLWYKNNRKIIIAAIIICLLVAFSRNYLGVHTLQDIIVGLAMAFVFLICTYKILNWCEQGNKRDFIVAMVVSVISSIIFFYIYFKTYPVLHDSLGNAVSNPEHDKWAGTPKFGFILGSFWGWYWERNFVKFNPQCGHLKMKIIRLCVGLMLLIPLVLYSKVLLKHCVDKHISSFIYMFVVSLFITFVYPWIVTKIPMLKGKK